MTSAFSPPRTANLVVITHPQQGDEDDHLKNTTSSSSRPTTALESETEDEEVKLNCLGGLRSTDDSDMNTLASDEDFDSEDEDDRDDDSQQQQQHDRQAGVVSFVSRVLWRQDPRLVRPTASRHAPLLPPLELPDEESSLGEQQQQVEDEETPEDEEVPEVGARGVALPLLETEDEADEDDDDGEEEESCSESDMEGDDEDSFESEGSSSSDDEERMDDEEEYDTQKQPSPQPQPDLPFVPLERPVLEEAQAVAFDQEESASVILRALEEDDDEDEEISSLIIDSAAAVVGSSQGQEPLLMDEYDDDDETTMHHHHSHSHLIGVVQDRQDDVLVHTVPRVKRALSLDEAMGLSIQAREFIIANNHNGSSSNHKKRRKSDVHDVVQAFTLGPPAMTLREPNNKSRLMSPIATSIKSLEEGEDDSEDEELDGQLRYELESASTSSRDGDQSPVPLLTPPDSPVVFDYYDDRGGGINTTICEWPSNLVVDTAMTAVLTQVRPLEFWTEDESEDLMVVGLNNSKTKLSPSTSSLPTSSSTPPSKLTQLLRGISVSDSSGF